jgi:TRAP-type mannitol/chloroaromatic compound transport system permease small subunit
MITRSWSVWEGSVEAGGLPGVYLFKTLIAIFAVAFALQFISLFLKNLKIIISK